jgi:hypothetical protein
MAKRRVIDNFKEYHFQFRHITFLFVSLIILQLIISFINKATIRDFLKNTQKSYQRESAEELANLTTANLELILETISQNDINTPSFTPRIIQTFNIIFSQQSLQHEIKELTLIVEKDGQYYSIDDGQILYNYLFTDNFHFDNKGSHTNAVESFEHLGKDFIEKEEIRTYYDDEGVFTIYVPAVVRGEYVGTMYVKMQPDFSLFTEKIIASYNESSIIYISLILLGLVAMYFVSSYTLKERDEVQKQLLLQHEANIIKEINYEKELLFTKRIYHTHHKAEKIMGFIKEDLRQLSPENIDVINFRVTKYSNFISRVIYDMKWYDPPLQTIRNQIFQTDLNEVLRFLVDHIFLRIASATKTFQIALNLDEHLEKVAVNEFVVWEVFEPLIQNCIDHGDVNDLQITISTTQDAATGCKKVMFADNGQGISPELLGFDASGVKKLFLESTSTKRTEKPNSGYGCYIAYEMCKKCGWQIDAENLPERGCIFTITINHR